MAGLYRKKIGERIKEGNERLSWLEGAENNQGEFPLRREVCVQREDGAADREAHELKGKEGEPGTSSFSIKLPSGR